jgi:hypothetical protein
MKYKFLSMPFVALVLLCCACSPPRRTPRAHHWRRTTPTATRFGSSPPRGLLDHRSGAFPFSHRRRLSRRAHRLRADRLHGPPLVSVAPLSWSPWASRLAGGRGVALVDSGGAPLLFPTQALPVPCPKDFPP